jgi:translocator protein
MAAHAQVRLASFSAAAYATLGIAGILYPLAHSGNFRVLRHALSQPPVWLAIVGAALVAWGLARRQAWAWWLGVIAAGYQLAMLLFAYVRGPAFGHLPRPWTLIAMVLLALVLVLLLPRRARLACSR